MKPIPKLLSKTKLLRGFRCLKAIYLTIHHPELEPPVDAATQALFDQGNEVGREARKYYPDGVLINNQPWDFYGALSTTQRLIENQTTILFEAAFAYQRCYARIDILKLNPETKRFHLIEVKSTTKVKPEHITDTALQAWIVSKSGIPLEKISILHLNSECRYPHLDNLFKEVDITDEVRATYLSIQPKLHEIFTTLQQPNIPNIDIGPYCLLPTVCPFKSHCWQNIPEISIFNLPQIKNKKWDLYQQGVIHLSDANAIDFDFSELQTRVLNYEKTGERFIDHDAIQKNLSTWQFPLVFLDFETVNPAIPRFEGCGPYHHVPFQFSVHVWQTPNEKTTHTAFLHETNDDPRETLIPALLKSCGTSGSIVAYFSQFESERIQALADYSQEHKQDLENLITRMVDPLPIIRDYVYDRAFAGSFSLKSVAPALLGESQSYEGMQIANGNDAQRGFEQLISPDISFKEKEQLKEAMLAYCNKDTEVMVELAKWLFRL